MNLRFFCLIFLLQTLVSINSMHIINVIEKDNIEIFKNQINTGAIDINDLVIANDRDEFTLIFLALMFNAKKIINYLLENNVDLNKFSKQKFYLVSPLVAAICYYGVSIDILRRILNQGANINSIAINPKILMFEEKKYSLFHYLYETVRTDKQIFIANYLIDLYGKNVLPLALSHQGDLYCIEKLIENGAFLNQNILDTAKRFKAKTNILEFLKYQLDINKVAHEKLKQFPEPIIDIINGYSLGSKKIKNNKSSKKILSMQLRLAIDTNDIECIKNYVSNGGDLNFILQTEKSKIPILSYAIATGKENIANLLLSYDIDVNKKAIINSDQSAVTPLGLALTKKGISLDLVKILLSKKANIDLIAIKKRGSQTFPLNLAFVLGLEINNDKLLFVLDYLLKIYKENILSFVLENKPISMNAIKLIVETTNAKVDRIILEKAIKMEHHIETIKFLNGVFQLGNQFKENNINIPTSILGVVTDYYCIEKTQAEQTEHIDQKNCIIS